MLKIIEKVLGANVQNVSKTQVQILRLGSKRVGFAIVISVHRSINVVRFCDNKKATTFAPIKNGVPDIKQFSLIFLEEIC